MARPRSPRRGRVRLGAALGAIGLLAACAAPTPYQPADDGFGYFEQQIEDNRYRVSFAGNSVTPRDTVQNYLLYRAAEITVQSGHDYFKLVDQNVERSTRYFGTVDPFFGVGHSRFDDDFHDRRFIGSSTLNARPIDEYTAFADILVFEGEKPEGDVTAYDARDVLRRLEPIIQQPS